MEWKAILPTILLKAHCCDHRASVNTNSRKHEIADRKHFVHRKTPDFWQAESYGYRIASKALAIVNQMISKLIVGLVGVMLEVLCR